METKPQIQFKKRFGLASALIIAAATLPSLALAQAPEGPKPPEAPAEIILNPEVIRHQLLESNLSIYQALQRVHDAKDQINIARANLLPSIGLSGLLNMTSGPSFALSSVTYLLPFLLPSNWFNLYQQKSLFESELLSYRILELNTYSSALTSYYTTLADFENQAIYQRQYEDLRKMYEILKRQDDLLGLVPPEDLAHAKAQADVAQLRASQMAELCHQEIAAIRKALGLPLHTVIKFEKIQLPASDFEEQPIEAAVEKALSIAPERAQIDLLASAARHSKWSKALAFINSAALSSSGQNASFTDVKGTGSINLGFATYPTFILNNRNIKEIELRQIELEQETTRLMEASLNSLRDSKYQYELAGSAEESMRRVYEIKLRKYDLGFETLTNVLLARSQMAETSVARIQAERDLNFLRTALHRALLGHEFEKIQGCVIEQPKNLGFWKRLARFFGGGTSHKRLDQVCTEAGNRL